MSDDPEIEALRREITYLRRMSEFNIGRLLRFDTQSAILRQELEQRRRGFGLMAELAMGLGRDLDKNTFLASVSRRLHLALKMQRTAVLLPDETEHGLFQPSVLQGYSRERRQALMARQMEIDQEFLSPLVPVLITGADPPDRLARIREALKLPFLISVPVMLRHELVAILVTGRLEEKPPLMPRLGWIDVETVRTVSAYLGAIMAGHHLAKVENLANLDPLTYLPNHRMIQRTLRHILAQSRRSGHKAAVLFIDLDNFKGVNDTYGHAAGDAVLHAVADRLKGGIRESDMVGRMGGDEFVAVLANLKHAEDASVVADKIIEKISEPIHFHGARYQIGASIGIALFPDHGTEASALLALADEAMYLVKKRGKNSFLFSGSA
jgi:diguanylate cyclase (GGDEF)-like protein